MMKDKTNKMIKMQTMTMYFLMRQTPLGLKTQKDKMKIMKIMKNKRIVMKVQLKVKNRLLVKKMNSKIWKMRKQIKKMKIHIQYTLKIYSKKILTLVLKKILNKVN